MSFTTTRKALSRCKFAIQSLILLFLYSVQVKGFPVRIAGMSLFQHRIKPEWEDEVNKNGGTLQINFKTNLPFLQTLWQKLVFSVVTDTFENADMIAGIRLLDKSVMGRENMFRFEIWTKFDNTQQILVESLQ